MKSGLLYTMLLCAASAGFVSWRVHALNNQVTPHFELVEDPSLSHPEGCESLVGLAEKALSADPHSPGSTLTVLVIGDETTANEPWQLGTYSIPTTRKVLEGKAGNSRARQDVLRDILNKCRAVRRTNASPIFLGVKQAVADLRAKGCGETTHCRLLIDSDLEENVEPSVKKNLNGTIGKKNVLPLIENNGIEVTFCGLAVTTGRLVDSSSKGFRNQPPRTPAREDQLREVWRSLFAQPETVMFEPYCPQPSALGLDMTLRASEKGAR